MRWSWVVVLLAGCQSILGIDDFHTATPIDADTRGDGADAAPDAPTDAFVIDTPPGSPCFGTLSPVCFATAPTGNVMLAGAINTDTDSLCQVRTQAGGPDLCAIAGDTITIQAAGVTVSGSRPLVLVGTTSVVVVGALNVSSANGGQIGAGANGPACTAGIGMDGLGNGGGGGAGGTFGQRGGAGGTGGGGAAGGAVGNPLAVMRIRGGCGGAAGGAGEGTVIAAGGRSGGAVALIAVAQIRIETTGGVFASGGGGSGAIQVGVSRRGGGGGGGSGGLIVLEAPTIDLLGTGTVTANGGGGGGGTRDGDALPGENGSTVNYSLAASGGAETGNGGQGGQGGAGTNQANNGQGAGNSAGGGGGGGGVGVIWLKGTRTGTRFSPAPLVQP